MGSTSGLPVKCANQFPCYLSKIKLDFLTCSSKHFKLIWSHGRNSPQCEVEYLVYSQHTTRWLCDHSKSLHLCGTHLPHLKRRSFWTSSVVLNRGWSAPVRDIWENVGHNIIILGRQGTEMLNMYNVWDDPLWWKFVSPKLPLRYWSRCSSYLFSHDSVVIYLFLLIFCLFTLWNLLASILALY